MARVDQTPGEKESYSMDQWPGYEMNRRRILKFMAERKIANPVVLGWVDAQAFFASPFGSELTRIATARLPLGQESGFAVGTYRAFVVLSRQSPT